MTKLRALLLVGLLAALPLSGCIENMRDLKDRLGATEEPVDTAATDNETLETPEVPEDNVTTPLKPPVARITLFGANGALVYKSSFEAADPEEPVFVRAPVTLQLLASDSETLEPGATITDYAWDFAGMNMTGAKVEHALSEPGSYPLTLTVKDSKGSVDTHNVTIAISPEPFDVTHELVTGPVAGAEEAGQTGTATFDVTLTIDEKPHTAQQAVIETSLPDTCLDVAMIVTSPDGTETRVDDAFVGDETVTFTEPAEGTWTVTLSPFSCVAPTGVPILVTVTYVQLVDGVASGGDGHGHAH